MKAFIQAHVESGGDFPAPTGETQQLTVDGLDTPGNDDDREWLRSYLEKTFSELTDFPPYVLFDDEGVTDEEAEGA